jgi:hypothetical protein
VRAGSVKRIGAAVGQGAVAMAAIAQYLHSLGEAGVDIVLPELETAQSELDYEVDEGHMLEAAGDGDVQPD